MHTRFVSVASSLHGVSVSTRGDQDTLQVQRISSRIVAGRILEKKKNFRRSEKELEDEDRHGN